MSSTSSLEKTLPINIDFAFPGYAVYAVIGIIVIVALFFRMFLNRQRQVIKPVRDYHCISAQMAWGGGNNTVDDTIDSAPADSVSIGQEVGETVGVVCFPVAQCSAYRPELLFLQLTPVLIRWCDTSPTITSDLTLPAF